MTDLLLRLSPLTIALGVVRLALVAAVGVLVVHPPEPDPVPREVTVICVVRQVRCTQLDDQIRADMQEQNQ